MLLKTINISVNYIIVLYELILIKSVLFWTLIHNRDCFFCERVTVYFRIQTSYISARAHCMLKNKKDVWLCVCECLRIAGVLTQLSCR